MIQLMKKRIFPEEMEFLYDRPFTPESLAEDFEIKGGEWYVDEDGWLIGANREKSAAMVMSKGEYFGDVLVEFDAATVLPATRDLNAVFCTTWDEEKNYLGKCYVVGLNGWYESKSGIERYPGSKPRALTPLYHYEPGTEVEIITGAIDGHAFLMVDGVLIQEMIDKEPIIGGHVGFSPYSTILKIKDIEVREIVWERRHQFYTSEF